jgi:anti-sigma regulatory factor (Ser/Thr protein kinase)
MNAPRTDVLVKPDMVAVLERTHLSKDLKGFLLPVLESVSNAIHAVEARFGSQARQKGKVEITIKGTQTPNEFLVSVTDNGVGLDDDNYLSFRTPFSGYKLRKNGRGFGRFIAFKVFSRIHYSSRYGAVAPFNTRTFRFDIYQKEEIVYNDEEPDFSHQGLRVEYNLPSEEWHPLIKSLNRTDIAEHIGTHFIPQFLQGELPEITIQFDGDIADSITAHFNSIFVTAETGHFPQVIDAVEEKIDFSLAKIPRSKAFNSHCLLFSAVRGTFQICLVNHGSLIKKIILT